MTEPDAECSVCVAPEADAMSERGSGGPPLAGGAELDMVVLGCRRAAPLAHTAEPSLDADRRILEELVVARASTRFAIFRGKPLACTTARTRAGCRKTAKGGLPLALHLRSIQFLKARCCSAPGHSRQKHHPVDEPDIAALPPSAKPDAQMLRGLRADQHISDHDELSDLELLQT